MELSLDPASRLDMEPPSSSVPVTEPVNAQNIPPIAFLPSATFGTQSSSTPSSATIQPKAEPVPEPPLDGFDEEDEFDLEDDEDDDPNAFRIRDALQEPSCQRFTMEELHIKIHESDIDLCPPYQRDIVWTESKQIALIDSIFHNYYVPPIVFAVDVDDDGEEVRVCVDGKQRLTSIQKFMDGQIQYKDTKTKKSWWYTVPDSLMKQRQLLPDHAKRLFASKKITCMEYRSLPKGAERDIFQRVQMGMTLTMAERLQAISSPWADWITQLELKHVGVEGGLAEVLNWDVRRGRDFQNVAYMVFCCDGLPDVRYNPQTKPLEKWLSRLDPPQQNFREQIEVVLRDFWRIATDSGINHSLHTQKRLAPIEFIFIGVLLFVIQERTLEEKAASISHLRDTVRTEFRDIRANNHVAKFLWTVVSKLETNEASLRHTGVRKRKKAIEDDDEEYRPSPISSLGKSLKTRSRRKL